MLRSKFSSLREYLTPISHASNFSTTGEINPEEFVQAGDYLVSKFPTWEWSTCPKDLQKSFLPADKQFLITKHVPSYQRASNYLTGGIVDFDEEDEEYEDEEGDGWVKSRKLTTGSTTNTDTEQNEQQVPEINDIDDLIDENAEDDDEDADDDFDDLDIKNTDANLRRYDLYITYSTSYRVPKMYLVGYSSNGIPLNPEQMFEDINSDYKDKTATIENLPVAHNTTSVSIHPCKHSSVMKVLMKHSELKKQKQEDVEGLSEDLKKTSITSENKTETTEEPTIRVDQYLVVFLKFIASVTPGIEYDYTTPTFL
ncbi:autophagocytosis associated protein [Scheffersomyces xylosifermentans]|uniref:autophagocytosis associated protein n=1 Tax=Scheffersomyces xylosifermentans TaxID=1304137 RepID=UPI00315DD290